MTNTLQATDTQSSLAQKVIATTLVGLGMVAGGALFVAEHLPVTLPKIDPLAHIAMCVCLSLAGFAVLGRSRKSEHPSGIPLHKQPGGKILLSYQIASFVVLRLYGLAFLAMSYGYTSGALDHPNLPLVDMVSTALLATVCAVIGLGLLVPVLTPRILSRPETVLAGAFKALLLIALSAPIYFQGIAFLDSGTVKYGTKFIEIVPMLFKSIAGLSITGAIMVSMATQLTEGERTPEPIYDHLSKSDLKALRKSRMTGPM